MKHDTECDYANDLMMKYMDGVLTEKEAEELRKHTDNCPACKESLAMYDFINEELNEESGLNPAPPGFTESVMKLVEALPSPKKYAASGFDRILCVVFGVFSLLFGAGFALVMNRDAIINYLSGIPFLKSYIDAVSPVSSRISEAMTGVADSIGAAFMTAVDFISRYQFVVFGVFAALVISQLVLSRRKASSGDKAKVR